MSGRAGIPDTLDRLRIGAPTERPDAGDLSLEGDLSVGGNVTIDGNLTPAGNLTLTGTLTVAGQANLAGGVVVTGGAVFNNGVILSGTPTPVAQTVAFGDEVDARAMATGRGTIAMPGGKTISNEAWLKVYSGTTPYWLPMFSGLYSAA